MLTIYSSSAGSGKTYTLTKAYLNLALRPGAEEKYYRHILAITFTNAAANEMKERILTELRLFAEGQQTPLFADVVRDLYGVAATAPGFAVAASQLANRAKTVFKAILHDYSNFAVTTIDAFTQRLVMAFTEELGLPYSFEVEMETDDVLELAIDNLIERAGTEEMDELTDILRQYFLETASDGKNWNHLPDILKEFGKNLVSDQHYEAINRVQELTTADIRTIREQLRQFTQSFAGQLIEQGKTAWTHITGAGLDEKDFSQGRNGIGAFFKGVAQGDVSKNINSYHRKAIDNDEWCAKKTPVAVVGRIDSITDLLRDCFGGIESLRNEQGELVVLFECLLPHLQKLSLLKQIRVEFDALLRKDGRVHISEFNKKIQAIVATEPVPFLYEKLGNRYNHILIDEFQDTSKLQFANLLPLLENSLGFSYSNLAVGDGKQAIYRWRGGDMDQIVALHRQDLTTLSKAHGSVGWTIDRIQGLGGHLQSEVLDTNWRSAAPIVQFNNHFFDFVARKFEFEHGKIGDVFDAAQQFQQQPAPKARSEGHVQIDFVGKEEEVDLTTAMLTKTLDHIGQALAEGYRYGDMAVLCRRKEDAKALANELNARQIPLVSADSLSLQFSDPVKWLVALMRLLHRPDQLLLRYEVLYLFSRVVQGVFPNDTQTEALRAVAEQPDIAHLYAHLAEAGYAVHPELLTQLNVYELTEKLAYQFGLFDQPAHSPFLFRFLDEVLTFGSRQSGHLADFLHYWETVQHKISVGAGATADAISIQTIHKAKGLEYPVVIVPFANWSAAPITNSSIWLDLETVEAVSLGVAKAHGQVARLLNAPTTINQKLTEGPTTVAAQYADELTRTFLENMNMLYVAFTRPINRLYIISERKEFDKAASQKTIAYWLYAYLRDSEAVRVCGCGWEDSRSSYVLSDCPTAYPPPLNTQPTGEIYLDHIISGHRGQELQLRRQAERVFDIRTFERTRERDRKIGAALSLMRGPDCLERALRQLVSEGVVRAVECLDLRDRLRVIITHPDVADLFDATLRIDTDRSIIYRNRLQHAPHRVVHWPDGRVVLAQYETKPTAWAVTDGQAGKSLRFFTSLYRDMGYAAVEGRLIVLGDEVTVERV